MASQLTNVHCQTSTDVRISQQANTQTDDMERFAAGFEDKLVGIDLETLEQSTRTICCVDRKLNINHVNPSWVTFALSNGANEANLNKVLLGSSITQAIGGRKIRDFYVQNYTRILDTGEVWRHDYECSTHHEYRLFSQIAYPLKDGEGLIIINSLKVNFPMDQTGRKAHKAIEEYYTQSTGFIVQCTNCRHTLRADDSNAWDWVPEWVERMPKNCNHTICPTCFDYYWKYHKMQFTRSTVDDLLKSKGQ